MIILTDCLTEKVDEGCLKVANNLAKRIKKSDSDTVLISYGRGSANSDLSLRLNKLFLNRALFSEIKAHEGSVLYIPFASNTLASILRSCVLSLFSKRRVYALFALRHPMGKLAKWILKKSRFFIVALSAKSFDYYSEMATDRVLYLRTGVDTQRFCPIDGQKKLALKKSMVLMGKNPLCYMLDTYIAEEMWKF